MHRSPLAIVALLTLVVSLSPLGMAEAQAQKYPEVVWKSTIDKQIRVELEEGFEVTGQLLGYEDGQIVLAKPDGGVVTLDVATVVDMRVVDGAAAPAPAAPPPRAAPAPAPAAPPPLATAPQSPLPTVAQLNGVVNDNRAFDHWVTVSRFTDTEREQMRKHHRSYRGKASAGRGIMALSLGLSLGGVVPAVVGCLDAGAFEGDIFGSISTAAGVCGLGITLIASGFTILIAGGTGLSKSMEGDLSRMRVIVSGAGQQSSLGSHRFHLALRFSAGSLSLSGSF